MNTEGLSNCITVKEAALVLGVAEGSIYRMIHEDKLDSRHATADEIGVLLVREAIRGVPWTGICLLYRDSVEQARTRKKGRPKKTV